jgi:hypothetical protein
LRFHFLKRARCFFYHDTQNYEVEQQNLMYQQYLIQQQYYSQIQQQMNLQQQYYQSQGGQVHEMEQDAEIYDAEKLEKELKEKLGL